MAKDKNYSIMGHRHHTTKTLGKVDSHNLRRRHEKNVDPAKTHLNRHLVYQAGQFILDDNTKYKRNNRTVTLLDERIKSLGITGLQAGQAVVMEINLTVSPEWTQGKTKAQVNELLKAQINWARDKFGDAILAADLHLDESTPHWHILVMPLVEQERKVRQSKRQKESGEPQKTVTVRTLSMSTVFTPEALELAHTELAERLKPFGLHRGEHRARDRNRVRHTTLKEHRALVEQQLPALREEYDNKLRQVSALDLQIAEKMDHVRYWSDELPVVSKAFVHQLETYYRAAEVSPRLADWQRVQQSHDQMPKTAQNALQDVLEEGRKFNEKHIEPYRLKR